MERLLIFISIWIGLSIPSLILAQHRSPEIDEINIKITGIQGPPLQNVWYRLDAEAKLIENQFTKPVVWKFYKDIPKEIQKAIAPYGYFKPHIHSHISRHGSSWAAKFQVDPGPQMKWTTVELQIKGPGRFLPAIENFYTHFPLRPGENFDANLYEKSKNELLNIAADYGFFQAKLVTNKITIDLGRYQSHVVIVLDTGARSRFGKTFFSSTPFSEKFLQRFLYYHPYDFFDQNKIRKTRLGLANSEYFSTVIITPQTQAQSKEIPISIQLRTQPKKQYNVGLGWGSDTQFRASLGASWRWINSLGHRFTSYLRIAQRNSAFINTYYIPGRNPSTDQYLFSASIIKLDQVTGHSNGGYLTAGYQTYLGGWQQLITLTALREKYSVRINRSDRLAFPLLPFTPNILTFESLPFVSNTSTLVYPSLVWQRLFLDSALNPRFGYRIWATLLGSPKLFSSTAFLQMRIDNRFLFTFFRDTRLILNASFGHISVKNIYLLPLSLQFFLGGPQNLRGFRYNYIGPGKNLFFSSIEIQQKIKGPFYIVGFFDIGNVANNIFKEKLNRDFGPGIAFMTPVGIFELTIARGIGPGVNKHHWQIQFTIGPPL